MKESEKSPIWIDVKDRLPELREDFHYYYSRSDNVLAFSKCGNIYIAYLTMDPNFNQVPQWIESGRDMYSIQNGIITHWMPLPKPPTDNA